MESTTAFVLVSSFDAAKIQEGRDFQAQLLALGYFLRAVITNRAWPQWAPADSDARDSTCALLKVLDAPALAVLYTSLSDCYLARQPLAAGFPSAVMVPEMDEELIGLGALDRLAARLCPPPDAAKDGAV
jgi:hypothetical protein